MDRIGTTRLVGLSRPALVSLLCLAAGSAFAAQADFGAGTAARAFDQPGSVGGLAEVAAASGVNNIYGTGRIDRLAKG